MEKLISYFGMFILLLSNTLYAEGEAQPARDQGLTQTLVMIGIALLFFYLILWRPEQKRRKAMETQRNTMKKGDRVTAMGIVGTVVRVQEQTVIVKMVDGSKIEFLKMAISEVFPGNDEDAGKIDKEDKSSSKKIDISDAGV